MVDPSRPKRKRCSRSNASGVSPDDTAASSVEGPDTDAQADGVGSTPQGFSLDQIPEASPNAEHGQAPTSGADQDQAFMALMEYYNYNSVFDVTDAELNAWLDVMHHIPASV